MAKLIETALPLTEINNAAIRERAGRIGHPANLHMWWGRSPEASSLAALAASVLDDSEETAEKDRELIATTASGDKKALERLRSRVSDHGYLPPVWDAFAGFGGIPIAAQKLGMKVLANDLNPVAAMLTRAAVDIPARFASGRPVHPGPAGREHYTGTEGLAEDIQFYGEWMENQAMKRLAHVYPQTEGGEMPVAWLWVRTVKCPNPACNGQIPLGSSYILSKSKTSPFWAEPVVQEGHIGFEIHEGECPPDKESNKIGSGAKFRCPVCGEATTDGYVRHKGAVHELGAEMMAVVTRSGGAKYFSPPDRTQREAAAVKEPEDVPPGVISADTRRFAPPGFGFTEYADIFTPRQLLMLCTFSDLVAEAQNIAASAALAAGMSEWGGSLEEGGAGALAYGQAVGVYLALAVDKMATHNSAMCSWQANGGSIRSIFGRRGMGMVWTFAEANPFTATSSSFRTMLTSTIETVQALGTAVPVPVTQGNAVTMTHPQHVMICTELPYYQDISYADLSDFFYIWLRRSLKLSYPEMFASMTTPKEELSAVSNPDGSSKEDAAEKYRADMKTVVEKLWHSSREDYPALLFYRFRKTDLESILQSGSGRNGSAWEFMLDILLAVGFAITAVWPMRSEPVSEKAESTRVLIVARKGSGRKGLVTRRSFVNTLKRELPMRIQLAMTGHISPEDELLSYMGQGLGIFSQYQTVLNADGSAMCVHDALQVIVQECMNALSQREENAPAGDRKAGGLRYAGEF